MSKKLEVSYGSPVDYNFGVVYLSYEDKHLCLINKEKGIDNLELEFFQESEIKISLDDFLQLLKEGIQEIKIE